jgi:RND family efflux transporter MFP subunit
VKSKFLAVLLAAQFLSLAAVAQTATAPTQPPAPPAISVMVAKKKPIKEELVVTGSFAAGASVQVAPLVQGYAVVEILAEEGDEVRKGQVLARLDDNDVRILIAQNDAAMARNDAAVLSAKNQIQQAKISRNQALSDLNRTKKLRSTGVSTVEQFDQRQAAFDLAAAQLDGAEIALAAAEADRLSIVAQRKELELRKARTELTAPVDGFISQRSVEYGMISSAGGNSMFDIVALGQVKLVAEVPESDLPKVKKGLKATIAVNGYDKALEGEVALISPEVDRTTRIGEAHIKLKDGVRVPLGAFGRATIALAAGEGVTLPLTAVTFGEDGPTVQIVKNGTVEVRRVITGLVSTTDIEITDGVAEGESFVARAGSFVRDGDAVTPVVVETTQ